MLLIIVGATLRAEMADRPLAYRMVEKIVAWHNSRKQLLRTTVAPVVCTDLWYMNDAPLQQRPVICIGGPGVNALSAYFAQKLNAEFVQGDQIVIQLDPEFVDLRACIWGNNNKNTIAALDYFYKVYFDSFMCAVATQVEPAEG